MSSRIEELQAEINRLKAEEKAALDERRNSVKPVYRFTIQKSPQTTYKFTRLMDDSVTLYDLHGELLNKEEFEAVGKPVPMTGSMTYVFNKLNGHFVMPTGGGSVWISDRSWHFGSSSGEVIQAAHDHAFLQLETFLSVQPEGGDVTEIVNQFRKATEKY